MSEVEAKVRPQREMTGREPVGISDLIGRASPRRISRVVPVLITMLAVTGAVVLGRAMWDTYMGAPWTRDGTVRAYVVTMSPEVSGRIVELPVVDNQFVRKGDLLMVIDPTNYRIAVNQAEAAVGQAEASVQNVDAQIDVQQAQISADSAQVDEAQAALVFAKQQAGRYSTLAQDGWGTTQDSQKYISQKQQQDASVRIALENLSVAHRQIASLTAQRMSAEASLEQAKAQLGQARVNLGHTRITAPTDGYVTNLLARLGNYVNLNVGASIGANTISLVDADSFWVDGYFEETNLASIRPGDPAEIKLMGYSQVVRGHVDGIAREINVANAQPNGQGVATVNPIFTWVRLAQRIPVHIQIDSVPPGITLVAGTTATVQINSHRDQSAGARLSSASSGSHSTVSLLAANQGSNKR